MSESLAKALDLASRWVTPAGILVVIVLQSQFVSRTEFEAASEKLSAALAASTDVFVVIADESRRSEALQLVQTCREIGLSTDFPLKSVKVGKQFQEAEHLGARHAVVIGQEWPQVKLKHLATRAEETLDQAALAPKLKTYKLNS